MTPATTRSRECGSAVVDTQNSCGFDENGSKHASPHMLPSPVLLVRKVVFLRPNLLLLLALLAPTRKSVSAFARTPVPSSPSLSSSSSIRMSASAKDCPFGAWESPITSKAITAGSVKLGGLYLGSSSSGSEQPLYWLEGRPQEGGRNVLCQHAPGAPGANERSGIDATPESSNARTRVHEYGGGAVVVGRSETNGDRIFVSDFATQQLCELLDGPSLRPITPMIEKEDGSEVHRYRYADGVYDDATESIYCVREDHGPDGAAHPRDVTNTIVAVEVGSGETRVIAEGNDFYAAPRLSPDGKTLAYVTWNHPNMPWDATELRVTSAAGGGDHSRIAGGVNGDDSILQPCWHPTTGDLYYLSDASGHYNLYRASAEGGAWTADPSSVLPLPHDLGGAAPGWVLGQQGYSFSEEDGRLLAVYKKEGASVLLAASLEASGENGAVVAGSIEEYGAEDGLPMMFGGMTTASSGGDVYFIGGSPSTSTSIYKWNLNTKGPAEILVQSSTLSFEEGLISVPEQVEFPTTNGKTAFGYYYAPQNSGYTCTSDTAPPLLVKAHGGPTACTGTAFNAGIQFWTSRGFAVLDVDYGGSTGYGKDYRRRLRGSWGIVDIDDVCAGAKHMVEQGKADGERLCIDGGSAGGYTTLGALAFRDVFKAGCSLYGIGDLTALAGDTHKFESRYLDGLVGPYPEDKAVYEERSPIESVDTLSCPILLLQGAEDKVVPPNQAKMMHEALLQKKIPTCLKIYEGEQHGFRQAANIEDALDSELAFYGKVFGIRVPGAIELAIDNLCETATN